MFYLYGRHRVCYIRNGQKECSKLKFIKRDACAQGLMAWAGVSYHVKTAVRIIP